MSAGDGPGPPPDPEVGRASLWFLRALAAVTVLVVLWFLVDAISG